MIRLPFHKIRFHSTAFLPIYYLIVIGLLGFVVLLQLFMSFQVMAFNSRPAPSLVQMVDGKVIKTSSVAADFRTPEVINNVVQNWATLTLSWSGLLPNGSPDPGIDAGGSQIPTSTWTVSFLLSEDFRQNFLEKLAAVHARVRGQQAQTALQILHISEPKVIATSPNKWQVNLISNLLLIRGGTVETFLPFNKKIFLQTVPLPTKELSSVTSPIQKVVEAAREAGVEIYKIQDLPPETDFSNP
jgi:hypothetical protein